MKHIPTRQILKMDFGLVHSTEILLRGVEQVCGRPLLPHPFKDFVYRSYILYYGARCYVARADRNELTMKGTHLISGPSIHSSRYFMSFEDGLLCTSLFQVNFLLWLRGWWRAQTGRMKQLENIECKLSLLATSITNVWAWWMSNICGMQLMNYSLWDNVVMQLKFFILFELQGQFL